jgi:hypothetical protein
MTRLGSKLSFKQAADEVYRSYRTEVTESTLRGTTHRYGEIAEKIECDEAERIEKEKPESTEHPKRLLVSEDGAYIRLTSGNWREVKTMAVGEIESTWSEATSEVKVQTKNLSYFSRSYGIRGFERYALVELYRRGLDNAQEVVTVNDGAEWIESFADYHFPQAIRILDFHHATGYIAAAGKAIWDEEEDTFKSWFRQMTHQLKHNPPRQTIADICQLESKADSDRQIAAIDDARRYLQKRETMIDYPHFRRLGLPIGSGAVESSHKQVVQSRMKQAGMRWAEHHVDSMLALRNLVCNDRWSEGWSQIVDFYWQQQHQEFHEQAKKQQPQRRRITFDSVKVAPEPDQPQISVSSNPKQESKHAKAQHPWRKGIWPTRESWRWN